MGRLFKKSTARVLCVDDDESVLSGIGIYLRRRFDFHTATSGPEALEMVERAGNYAVIVSDMRMPGMNGAEFLSKVRALAPDTTRLLLTGQSNLDDAIAAINEGRIFRFLTKPTPPKVLTGAIEDAVHQHELVRSERILLEQTLTGSIQTLTDILALTNPIASGRASQLLSLVRDMARAGDFEASWEVEVAAMLSQLGSVTLPMELAERFYRGAVLDAEEQELLDRAPKVASSLLDQIPRLDGVLATLEALSPKAKIDLDALPANAGVLIVADSYLRRRATGEAAEQVISELRNLPRLADFKDALDVLEASELHGGRTRVVLEVPIRDVKIGMVFTDDVFLSTGALFVSAGYEATSSFVERARNLRTGLVQGSVRVFAPLAPSGEDESAASAG